MSEPSLRAILVCNDFYFDDEGRHCLAHIWQTTAPRLMPCAFTSTVFFQIANIVRAGVVNVDIMDPDGNTIYTDSVDFPEPPDKLGDTVWWRRFGVAIKPPMLRKYGTYGIQVRLDGEYLGGTKIRIVQRDTEVKP